MYRTFLSACAAIIVVFGQSQDARAVTVLKMATLAPADSPYGRGFKKYAKAVSEATKGELQIDIQYNGQAGEEKLMVQKIRAGQLDGAAISGEGIAETGVIDALIFQLGSVFPNWAKLHEAREAVSEDLEKEFQAKGLTVLGWGDVGAAHTMSVGFPVIKPDDLRGKGAMFLWGDPVAPKFYASLGGVTPKQGSVGDILPGLTSGTIAWITAPALAAEQFQWASRVTHVNSVTDFFVTGAFVMSAARMQALPAPLKEALLSKSREMNKTGSDLILRLDAQAYERLKKTKIVVGPDAKYYQAWQQIFDRVGKQLRGRVFTPAVYDKVMSVATSR
jgi:TRAP-type C4-dicarboxylate transport system substrate-binding protein